MDNRCYLRIALNKSGVYNTENKNINAELSAYEAGIDFLCSKLNKTLDNCFIETADSENILKRAELFRNYVITDDIEVLRNQLKEKMKIRTSSLNDMKKRLTAAGIEGEIRDEINKATVSVTSFTGVEAETAEAEIKKYMPAYIDVTLAAV